MEDIAATIAWLAARDPSEANAVTWDLMQEQPVTLGDVIDQFREVFGTGRWWRIVMPAVPARSRRQARRSRQPARLDAADAGTTAIAELAPRRQRRPRRLDGHDRHRAEEDRTDGRKTPRRPFRTNGLPGCFRSRRS